MLGENLSPSVDSLRPRVQLGSGAPNTNMRASHRSVPTNVLLIIRPSNSSQRRETPLRGYCKNLSQSGCGVITDCPPRVGDLYRFELPSDVTHPIHGCHARCVRCHLIDEDAFEVGFSFLSQVNLQTSDASATRVDDVTDPLN